MSALLSTREDTERQQDIRVPGEATTSPSNIEPWNDKDDGAVCPRQRRLVRHVPRYGLQLHVLLRFHRGERPRFSERGVSLLDVLFERVESSVERFAPSGRAEFRIVDSVPDGPLIQRKIQIKDEEHGPTHQ